MSPTLFLFLCWPTSLVPFHPAGAVWAHWWAVNTRVLLLRVIIVHIFTLHKPHTPTEHHYKEQHTTHILHFFLLSVIIMIFNLSHSQLNVNAISRGNKSGLYPLLHAEHFYLFILLYSLYIFRLAYVDCRLQFGPQVFNIVCLTTEWLLIFFNAPLSISMFLKS